MDDIPFKKSKSCLKSKFKSKLSTQSPGNGNPFGGSPKKKKQPTIWDDEGIERADRSIDQGIRDTERAAKSAYHHGKQMYHAGREAHGLIRSGVRRLRGNNEGHTITYSEGKGGQEFTTHLRSHRAAKMEEAKLRKQGFRVRID